jgi:hypothetical protein
MKTAKSSYSCLLSQKYAVFTTPYFYNYEV